ncbi:oligosaccharyl transferase, archaeosortase A system-associated [Natrarchaeobius halalkaliphilus]|uniref:dolichyl-phosphooligosaccharide-protein glycotransferase n=1 Tax=Natrarchaeobius halalkaliphilus TaxID=1679091 RepID=A0A3N6MFR7_9EURY|nr:oligosaccharyl transferase, archaeosortase A system-associated [Natrarchaeobius halalkaliphilus]RQG92756.1 oligosaccharyl transferase, archaeosortase A system-associated [Natrarchaeobius halalkaliphilus]
MSTDTDRVGEETESSASLLETWREWYHVPILGVVMLFMFWVRTQSYDRFGMEDGIPSLAAVDSWYHWRTVRWTAENYPRTMPYEIWTSFPTGRYVGQFGTLFDQIIVTVAMIVGLGDPSPETLYTVSLLAVPAMAALVAIPVFLMGRRLGGTIGGIASVLILALAPGQFLTRTTTGQLQHHVAEVLFMAIAILAMMVALRVAERERPIYELVADGDWDALRTPTVYSALAGIALSLYIWVWPPGIVLVGILAAFFTVQLCLDYVRDVSPDHVAFVGAVSLAITAVVTTLLIEQPGSTSTTSFGYLQPVSAALVAAGCVFMAWFARQWDGYDLDRHYYPAAIFGLIGATFLVMWLVLPSLFSTIFDNVTRRVIPFGETATDLTIQEAQPPGDFTAHIFHEFRATFYTMLVGLALLVARPFLGREYRTEYTLVIVWALFLTSMAATQIRFSYYLVLAVAVVNAVVVAETLRFLDFDVSLSDGIDSIRQVEAYQLIVLLMVVLLLFAPFLPYVAAAGTTAVDRGGAAAPHSSSDLWQPSNQWLAENTPEPGNWGGADRADELEPYGTYEAPEDGNYDYPEGSYGVISWWDYGHLITVQGERMPHSNPFQSGASSSSAFFTAESEERSELILDAIAADESPADRTDEQLESMVADGDSDEEIRYVMIDDQMAGGKFAAISTWSGPDYDYYTTPEDVQSGEQIDRDDVADRFSDVPYDNTTLSQLYFDDAVGMENYRLVHENDERTAGFVSYAIVDAETDQVLMDENGNHQVFLNRMMDQQTQQEIMLIQQHPQYDHLDIEMIGEREGSAVKTYERVEGATITGSADVSDHEDATVTAAVELDSGVDRGTFDYVQQGELDENGEFELTVPYATNDELGVDDGYTDSAVEATEEFTVTVTAPAADGDGFEAYEDETDVPETAVVHGEEVEVTLEEVSFEDTEEAPDETDGDDSNETDSEDDDSDVPDSLDGSTDEEDDTDESGSLAPVAADAAP